MSKTLDKLFKDILILDREHWDPKREVHQITSDSRAIKEGGIFVACPGSQMDGHDFLREALQAKPAVVVFEKQPDVAIPSHTTAVRVKDSRESLALLLNVFYDYPSRKVKLIGVTGTNGKTTITYLLHHLLQQTVPSALIGTLGYELPSAHVESLNTTPGSETLIPLLAQMHEEGVQYCVMEVSSHALSQKRIHGLEFELGIFTQLSQDHLDYHHSMERYFQTKRSFFSEHAPRHFLINRDCEYGGRLIDEWPKARTFSLESGSDYFSTVSKTSFEGSDFRFHYRNRQIPIHINLPLSYNISNSLAALGALDLLGFDVEDFVEPLEQIPRITGRMDSVSENQEFRVFIDYAHTPDAVERVLSDVKKLKPKRMIVLFGCGGDRDQGKRSLMTGIASCYADVLFLTSDNPRSEDPEDILKQMKKGLPNPKPESLEVHSVVDRKEAIHQAIESAKPEDVVLILGKGHEDYQILGDRKVPFSDYQIAEESLKSKSRVFLS